MTDIGDLTTKRYWWSHNQKILVISQQKILVISQPKDTGDLTAKIYWWSQNQKILVISLPKDIGDLTTKRYWWSRNKRRTASSESISAVILRATVSPLIPLCGRHSSTVVYHSGKQGLLFTFSSLSEGASLPASLLMAMRQR